MLNNNNRSHSKAEKEDLPGSALIQLLLQRAEELGLDKEGLAEAIGITLPYLRAIASGARPIAALKRDKFRNIATFLSLSYIQVLMLAEIITPTDFARDQNDVLNRKIEHAWQTMRDDRDWGQVAPTPEEWEALSPITRYGIALMWEKISTQELIEKAPLVVVERPQQNADETKPKGKKVTKPKSI